MQKKSRLTPVAVAIVLVAAALAAAGCSSNSVSLRPVPKTPLGDQLQLGSYWGPQPSPRTVQLLRVHNLTYEPKGDPRPTIAQLQAFNDRVPSVERVYAMGELAYLGGKSAEKYDKKIAIDLYGAAVLYAYQFLFDSRYSATRNQFDPQYRGACDLYNGALESGLRLIVKDKQLKPDTTQTIDTAVGTWDIDCKLVGSRWKKDELDKFEFCSDYEVKGLKNQYQTRGLGVPLIAVRHGPAEEAVWAKYYPPDLSFPVTAFLTAEESRGDRPEQEFIAGAGRARALTIRWRRRR